MSDLGVGPTPEPDRATLDRVRAGVDASARDAAYVAAVDGAVMDEADPALLTRVESIEQWSEAQEGGPTSAEEPLVPPEPRWNRWLDMTGGILFVVGLLTLVVADRASAPDWLSLLALAVAGVSLVGILVSSYLARLRKKAMASARGAYVQVGSRADDEVEAAFARIPADRVVQARALALALLREGYEDGRVREPVARAAVPLIVARWTSRPSR